MDTIENIAENCIQCGLCVRECAFLKTYGTPGQICSAFLEGGTCNAPHAIYSCNLCGLCTVVCPCELDCSGSFLQIRKQLAKATTLVDKRHKTICTYMKTGSSRLFSLDIIPPSCDTIFFPGCTLAGTRGATTEKTYNHLKKHISNLGIVLDCCSKMFWDLGRNQEFEHRFNKLAGRLARNGVNKIITACPSCYAAFKEHLPEFQLETVYETLAQYPPNVHIKHATSYTVHDACATRFERGVQDSVRTLASNSGARLFEMGHSRQKTICCGEGGAAMFVAPHIARKWKDIRSDERSGNKVITYCAGCSSTFGKSFAHSHLLDLLFSPELSVQGREKVQKAPFTYLSRLFLKRRLQLINRSSTSDNKKRPASTRLRIGLLLGLVLLVTVLHLGGVTDYFHAANLNSWIHTLQGLPPIVFVGVLALTPVLFLPTFPMVMIAGVLFGQGSGLLYSMLGACLGASISFLFSRYLASDWVLSKIPESQEIQLRQLVTSHGWKMVLLLRLVPLFPFTPLNYFLGLTGIRFTHYLAATFVGILPACAAFVFFSSSVRSFWTDGTKLPVFIAGFFLLLFVTGCLIAKRIILMKTGKSKKSNQRQQR